MKPNHKPLTELDMMILRAGWSNYVPNDIPRPINQINVGSTIQSARSSAAKVLRWMASHLEAHQIKTQTS